MSEREPLEVHQVLQKLDRDLGEQLEQLIDDQARLYIRNGSIEAFAESDNDVRLEFFSEGRGASDPMVSSSKLSDALVPSIKTAPDGNDADQAELKAIPDALRRLADWYEQELNKELNDG